MKLDIRNFIKNAYDCVERHKLENEGEYCRWLWQGELGPRDLGVNEYGCADAMNILYSIDKFDCPPDVRRKRIEAIQKMQNKDTGMFTEATHHTIHTTAHCTGALQLFGAKPLYPLTYLHQYYDKNKLYELLEGLFINPWTQSHQGAGVYAALENAGEMTNEFAENYFSWFWQNADEEVGFWKRGDVCHALYSSEREPGNNRQAVFSYMAGGFHYMFNHEHAGFPLRYPEKIVDSCIKMYRERALPPNMWEGCCTFIQVDWVYCLHRAVRQANGYREAEALECIREFAKGFIGELNKIDPLTDDSFNDLHSLFGTICLLAELQLTLPDEIITEKPLRLVLDRRPFI